MVVGRVAGHRVGWELPKALLACASFEIRSGLDIGPMESERHTDRLGDGPGTRRVGGRLGANAVIDVMRGDRQPVMLCEQDQGGGVGATGKGTVDGRAGGREVAA